MQPAITLAEWFKHETERVYGLLTEPAEHRLQRQLVEWIRQRGGRVRGRDVVSGRRDVQTAGDSDSLLTGLVNAGFARWEYLTGGRGPSVRECVLID